MLPDLIYLQILSKGGNIAMAEQKSAFRAPKPWQLTEKETISLFANWKSNLLYNLSLNNETGFVRASTIQGISRTAS